MLHDIYTAFLAPLLPVLIDKLKISYSLAGFLTVLIRIPSLLNPLIGLLADRTSSKYFVIIAPFISAVAMSLIGLAPGYTAIAILVFVAGMSSAAFHAPALTLIKETSGNQVGKGMSYLMLGGEIARTVGPLIILGAVSFWGLDGTYRLIPFGAAASIFLYFKLRDIKPHKKSESGVDVVSAKKTLQRLMPFFTVMIFIAFFRSILKSALTIYLPTFLNETGSSLWMAGISLSILQFSGAGGTFLSGIISDRIGRRKALIFLTVISPVLMLVFTQFPGVLTMPLLILMGFFLFATGPVLMALVQDFITQRPAFVNGVYMMISFGMASLGVLVLGFLADWIGLERTYSLTPWLSALCIPFVFLLPMESPPSENSRAPDNHPVHV
ncbi:MAG: MFS transporter [FCB group bacterium]|nr:MFS transporter [FCB group bacterium]